MNHLRGKTILVSGACGTVGLELVSRLLEEKQNGPAAVVGIDNNEGGLFFLDQHFQDDRRAEFFVCDICDHESLAQRMQGVDIVFHTAALKHVVLCERSPIDTVRTNIRGVENIIDAAELANVKRVIFTSSDKAVNPINVMGASKQAGERSMAAAAERAKGPVFSVIRFGNVLGSSGSVVPVFHRQIAHGGPVTLTDPGMVRFVMSVQRSVELIIEAARIALGGEIFVTKMPVVQIEDLAAVMIRELGPVYRRDPAAIEVRLIGAKPGEKLVEELIDDSEIGRAIELEHFFAILPCRSNGPVASVAGYDQIVRTRLNNPYTAADQTPMSQDALTTLLRDNGLLDATVFNPIHRYQAATPP